MPDTNPDAGPTAGHGGQLPREQLLAHAAPAGLKRTGVIAAPGPDGTAQAAASPGAGAAFEVSACWAGVQAASKAKRAAMPAWRDIMRRTNMPVSLKRCARPRGAMSGRLPSGCARTSKGR